MKITGKTSIEKVQRYLESLDIQPTQNTLIGLSFLALNAEYIEVVGRGDTAWFVPHYENDEEYGRESIRKLYLQRKLEGDKNESNSDKNL